jgi:hypothetical protein
LSYVRLSAIETTNHFVVFGGEDASQPPWPPTLPLSGQWQEPFVLDASQLIVRDHPFAGGTTTALSLCGHDAAQSTPFANSELGLTERCRHLGCGVMLFDPALSDDCIQRGLDAFQSLDEIVVIHDMPFPFSKIHVWASSSTSCTSGMSSRPKRVDSFQTPFF